MKTALLTIPTKKTEEVNWVKPLNSYLLSIYGTTSDYQEDITSFNKLRQDLRGVNADTTGIKLYYKYYSQIELLDLRIPFSTVNSRKRINFEWFDVFDHTISHKQTSLPFEKANVLFNLGALLSKYGSIQYQKAQKNASATDETTKEAIQLLQQAAGIYQFLNENFLHAPSIDLSQGTVQFLVKLMLAQSQEVFVLKVISGDLEQKKNSLISKLCRSTASHYESSFNMVSHLAKGDVSTGINEYTIVDTEDEEDEGFLENPADEDEDSSDVQVNATIDLSWVALIQFKLHFYKSLSYYFNGLHLESNRKYGEALAYLTKSSDFLNEISSASLKAISKSGIHEIYELLDNYKYQKDAVAIKLAELNKDNDLIFHDLVPSLVTLPDIKPMDSAKLIPIGENSTFQEVNDSNYNAFLNNVIPINIHELLSFYSEEKSQFLRNEIDLVDVSNEELSSVLEYLKMPKALVTVKELMNNDGGSLESGGFIEIDTKLKQIADEIEKRHSLDLQNKEKISELRKQIYAGLNEIDSALSNQVSEGLQRYRDDTIKIKKSLYDAMTNDTKLFGLVNIDNDQLYTALGKGSNSSEFKQLFSVPVGGTQEKNDPEISLLDMDESQLKNPDDDIRSQISKIEDILHDLNIIKANKNKLIDALKKEIHEEDISEILILNSKIKSTSEIKSIIFPEELKKFEPYNEELDKLCEKQKTFINDLNTEWSLLSKNLNVKNIQTSKAFKDQVVQDQTEKINKFYLSWQRYTLGLEKGVDFYTQLLNYCNGLNQNIARISNEGNRSLPQMFSNLNMNNSGPQPQYTQQQNTQQQHTQQQQSQPQHSQPQQLAQPSQSLNSQFSTPQYSQNQYSQPQKPNFPQQSSYGSSLGYGSGNQQYGTPPDVPSQQPSYGTQPNYFSSLAPTFNASQPTLYATQTGGSDTGSATGYGTYTRPAPQLPPKRPSQFSSYTGAPSYQNYQNSAPPNQSYQNSAPQNQNYQNTPPNHQNNPVPPNPNYQNTPPNHQNNPVPPQNQDPQHKNDLIYNQPSTYQPNMYNFFSQN